MKKQDLITELTKIHTFLTVKQANAVWNSIFDLIKNASMESPFNIQNFGTFKYVTLKGKQGKFRHPDGSIKEYTTKDRKVLRLKSKAEEL